MYLAAPAGSHTGAVTGWRATKAVCLQAGSPEASRAVGLRADIGKAIDSEKHRMVWIGKTFKATQLQPSALGRGTFHKPGLPKAPQPAPPGKWHQGAKRRVLPRGIPCSKVPYSLLIICLFSKFNWLLSLRNNLLLRLSCPTQALQDMRGCASWLSSAANQGITLFVIHFDSESKRPKDLLLGYVFKG